MPARMLQRFPHAVSRIPLVSAGWNRLWNFLSRGRASAGANRVSMHLAAGQELRLRDAAGWTVACLRGSVWITQEADPRDVFLDPGDSFALDRPGLALILARRPTTLAIQPPRAGQQAGLERPDSSYLLRLRDGRSPRLTGAPPANV